MMNVVGYSCKDALRAALLKLSGQWRNDRIEDSFSVMTLLARKPLSFNKHAKQSPMNDLSWALAAISDTVSTGIKLDVPMRIAGGLFYLQQDKTQYRLSVVWPMADMDFLFGGGMVLSSLLLHYAAVLSNVEAGSIEQTTLSLRASKKSLEAVYSELHKPIVPHTEPTIPIVENCLDWQRDIGMLDQESAIGFKSRFFRRVALPLLKAKDLETLDAFKVINGECEAEDWKQACIEWIDHNGQK